MKDGILCKEDSFNGYMTSRKIDEYVDYVLGYMAKPDWAAGVKEKTCAKIISTEEISANFVSYGQIYEIDKGYAVELEVLNRFGIHSRPAAIIVGSACKYNSEIRMFAVDGKLGVDTKNILDILTNGFSKGAILRFEATGEDAINSLDDLVKIFDNKFGEE